MTKVESWLGQHPYIVLSLIVGLVVLLIAAMAFGYDLAWIPAMLRGMVGQ